MQLANGRAIIKRKSPYFLIGIRKDPNLHFRFKAYKYVFMFEVKR